MMVNFVWQHQVEQMLLFVSKKTTTMQIVHQKGKVLLKGTVTLICFL